MVHADKHFYAFHPFTTASTTTFFECNDGGLYWTQDGGSTWNDISNGLGIGQIYRISAASPISNHIITGLQDNGTKLLYNNLWYESPPGGDGMECIIDYTNGNIQYATYVNGRIYKTIDAWQNSTTIAQNNETGVDEKGAWVTPYLMHPTNNNSLIVGKSQVYQTTNAGTSWNQLGTISGMTGKIKSMAYAPSNPQVIYVASDYEVFKTTNGGSTWGATPFATSTLAITYLAVDPNNPNKIWMTNSGYTSGDKIWHYNGSTWNNFSGTLPNVPANCIVYENGSNDGLYVGTDLGVYYRNATMTDWIPFATNLPNVVVNELEISYINNKIWAGTYGRGLWSSPLYTPAPSSGCTLATACNFDPSANINDGTCFFTGDPCNDGSTPDFQ